MIKTTHSYLNKTLSQQDTVKPLNRCKKNPITQLFRQTHNIYY